MYVPLNYQVTEYDCVPVAFINAVSYLFERREIPPMVIRHIYAYSLDTVGPSARLGSGGTSRHAVRLLGHWLGAYKYRHFSVTTRFLEGDDVHLRDDSPVVGCLQDDGVALCDIRLGDREEHYVMAIREEEGWLHCFDPYYRTLLRGLRHHVRIIDNPDGRQANLMIERDWMDQEDARLRFCLGPLPMREALLIWRNR